MSGPHFAEGLSRVEILAQQTPHKGGRVAIENQDVAAYLEIFWWERRRSGLTTTHSCVSFEERGTERGQNWVLYHHVVQD